LSLGHEALRDSSSTKYAPARTRSSISDRASIILTPTGPTAWLLVI
jgi:hypothetical protein